MYEINFRNDTPVAMTAHINSAPELITF